MRESDIKTDNPPGWDLNPSSWRQRLWLIIVSLIGFFIAAYLALYQNGVISEVWDPFFGDQSLTILNSPISYVLPVSDAALGAVGYLLDAVTGAVGGQSRWRTMPWMVIIFGLFVGPPGAISIILVILQPVAFNAWCFLCLVTAVISVVLISPAMDEVLASLQFMKREVKRGRRFWDVFWGREDHDRSAPHLRQPQLEGT